MHLIALLPLLCLLGNGPVEKENDLELILFQNGLPQLESYYRGQLVNQEFRSLTESGGGGLKAVVYALVADDHPSNPTHHLFLALLRAEPQGESIVLTEEITQYSPMEFEDAGTFRSVTAAVDLAESGQGLCSVVVVSLASRIHGRGSVSGGVDVFFSFDGAGTLAELAVVENTFSYHRLEPGRYASLESEGWLEPAEDGGLMAYFEITEKTLVAAEGARVREVEEESCVTRLLALSCSGARELPGEACGSHGDNPGLQKLTRAGRP